MQHYDEHGMSDYACGGGDKDCSSVEAAPSCEDGHEHKWTSEGCGGLTENPGVWSLGGTTYHYVRRCVICGAVESETHYGWQRNPGQCDERRYVVDPGGVIPAEASAERRRQRRNAAARRRRRAKRAETATV